MISHKTAIKNLPFQIGITPFGEDFSFSEKVIKSKCCFPVKNENFLLTKSSTSCIMIYYILKRTRKNMLHALEHSFLDTLKLIPFLFLTYLLLEWLEHKATQKTTALAAKAG
ncbi:MAG: hypothetical protein IKW18_03980, partial [Clostridia bacterium]|nr:hypothetical protein [Clostridia bacterium]